VSAPPPVEPRRAAVVSEFLLRSRLLEDRQFRVPLSIYREFLAETGRDAAKPKPPVAAYLEEKSYRLEMSKSATGKVTAEFRIRVLDAARAMPIGLLKTDRVWRRISVNGKDVELSAKGGWLLFVPPGEGVHLVTAEGAMTPAGESGELWLDGPLASRASVQVASPDAWEISADGHARKLIGVAKGPDGGTHGRFVFPPWKLLHLKWSPVQPQTDRPARYQLRGPVAWNLDAGRMQVSARLDVAILGGQTDRIELVLPGGAAQVQVDGPDVREAQASAGGATVYLRGRISERTRLNVHYELPAPRGETADFGALTVRDGRWAGGVLVVTNTAGGSELLPGETSGLREMALAEIPSSASAILAGTPALAYEIVAPQFDASVEVLALGEFALQESIADLAHYQLTFRPDGAIVCKAEYEIRNRTRQFVRLSLPAGAEVLLARVNDQSRPISPVPGDPGTCLLPLVRSRASVKGLVSFPLEVVYICRGEALRSGAGRVTIPLPRVDMPIAYAWSEVYLPDGMKIVRASGPMRRVEQYSSETAVAKIGYGKSEAAEGYVRKDRFAVGGQAGGAAPAVAQGPPPQARPASVPETKPVAAPTLPSPAANGKGGSSFFLGGGQSVSSEQLGRNYWRSGKDYYEKGDFENARLALENVRKLAPKSVEAENADRLLSNIKLTKGELKLKTRSEKAAGQAVRSDIAAANKELLSRQQDLLERGKQAQLEGRKKEALQQYQAAQSLSYELLKRGEDVSEQRAVLGDVQTQLDVAQKQQQDESKRLVEQAKKLEESGKYSDALKLAKKAQELAPEEGEKLQPQMMQLAAKAAKEETSDLRREALRRDVREKRRQLGELMIAARQAGAEVPQEEKMELAQQAAQEFDDVAELQREGAELNERIEQYSAALQQARRTSGDAAPAARPLRDRAKRLAQTEKMLEQATPLSAARISLEHADPADVQAMLEDLYTRRDGQSRVQVQPGADGSSVEIQAPADVIDQAVALARKLDTRQGAAAQGAPTVQPTPTAAPTTPVAEEPPQPNVVRSESEPATGPKPVFFGTAGRAPRKPTEEDDWRLRARIAQPADRDKESRRGPTSNFEDYEARKREVGARIASGERLSPAEFSPDDTWRMLEQTRKLEEMRRQVEEEKRRILLVNAPAETPPAPPKETTDSEESRWYEYIRYPKDRMELPRRGGAQDRPAGGERFTRVYDVRDLVVSPPGVSGLGPTDDKGNLLRGVRETLGVPSTAPAAGAGAEGTSSGVIWETNGQLVVTGGEAQQWAVQVLLDNLRQARGANVDRSASSIVRQHAEGILDGGWGGGLAQPTDSDHDGLRNDARLREFIENNYKWALEAPRIVMFNGQQVQVTFSADELAGRLETNLGQKVALGSFNLNAAAADASAAGARFVEGANGVRYAVIDEAQFLTLREIDARNGLLAGVPGERGQETIVGSDALLANSMTANLTYAAGDSNTFDVGGNAIALPHEQYVLIDNGRYLTAVRAGEMRHWTEKPELVRFADVPQNIDPPRAGRLVKFEKTLVKPTDPMGITVEYEWKGDAQ